MSEYDGELLQRLSSLEDRLERIETFISGLSEINTPTKAQSARIASKRIEAFVEDSKSYTASVQSTLDGISGALSQAHGMTSGARGQADGVQQELVTSAQTAAVSHEAASAQGTVGTSATQSATSDVATATGDVATAIDVATMVEEAEESVAHDKVAAHRKASALERVKNFDPSSSISKTLENKIGSNFMGVLASILIFIGIVSLAILIYPNLTREIRFVLMFAISIGITVAGGVLYRRKPNAFSISLFACGISTIYISLIITWAYFKYLTLHGVYITILVWGVGVCLITRKLQSYAFRLIYYIGITVAVLFGARFVEEQGDVIFLVFFQIIALATNIFLQLKDKTAKDDYTDAGFIVGLSMVQLTISPRVSWLYDSIWLGVGWAWIVLVRFVMITAFEIAMLYMTYRNAKYQKYYHGEAARIKIGYVASIYIISIFVQQLMLHSVLLTGGFSLSYFYGGLETTIITVAVSMLLTWMVSRCDKLCGLTDAEAGHMEKKIVSTMIIALLLEHVLQTQFLGFWREWTVLVDIPTEALPVVASLVVHLLIYVGYGVPSFVMAYKHRNTPSIINKILYVLLCIYLTNMAFLFGDEFGIYGQVEFVPNVIGLLIAILLSYGMFRKCKDYESHMVAIGTISISYVILVLGTYYMEDMVLRTGFLLIYSVFALLASLYARVHDRQIYKAYIYASIVWLYLDMLRSTWLEMPTIGLWLLLLVLGSIVVIGVISRFSGREQTANKIVAAVFMVPLFLIRLMLLLHETQLDYLYYRAGYLTQIVAGLIWIVVVLGSYSRVWKGPKDVLKTDGPIDMIIMRTAIYIQEVFVLVLYILPSITRVHYRLFYGGRLLDMHILIIMQSLAISCIGIWLHKKYLANKPAMNVWFGIKLTACVLGSVFSFVPYGSNAILASIICLICALAAVSIGFVVRYKEVRLYGLALSMLSIAKLVLVDISYRNSMSRVVGFIFAGLICFGISFLYNKLAQNFVDEETGV